MVVEESKDDDEHMRCPPPFIKRGFGAAEQGRGWQSRPAAPCPRRAAIRNVRLIHDQRGVSKSGISDGGELPGLVLPWATHLRQRTTSRVRYGLSSAPPCRHQHGRAELQSRQILKV